MNRGVRSVLLLATVVFLGGCSSTNPYIGIKPEGDSYALALAWLEFSNDDDARVTLVNMAHFGEAAFYDNVNHTLSEHDVVLMEGVTGEIAAPGKVMSHYREIAETLGITTQEASLKPQKNWRVSDVDASKIADEVGDLEATISSFNERMKEKLAEEIAYAKAKWPDKDEAEHKSRAQARLRQFFAEGLTEASVDSDPVIIVARNRFLLAHLDDYLETEAPDGVGKVAICWGVAHGPDLVARLKDRGWKLEEVRWHPVFSVTTSRPQF